MTINLCESVSFNFFRHGLTLIYTDVIYNRCLKKITGKWDSATIENS